MKYESTMWFKFPFVTKLCKILSQSLEFEHTKYNIIKCFARNPFCFWLTYKMNSFQTMNLKPA